MYSKTRRLNRRESSKYLYDEHGITRKPSTLATLATKGGGPAFQKDGRFPLYTVKALDEWVEAQLSPVVTSTAELKVIERAAYSPRRETAHSYERK